MKLRAKWVVPVSAPPIDNGVVEIVGDTIVAVGKSTDADRDLGDVALLPGLINAHCHFNYTNFSMSYRDSFTDWLNDIIALKRQQTPADYLAGIAAGMDLALHAGTTTVVNIECFPELIAKLPASQLRVIWCPELISVSRQQELPAVGDGLAPHAPYTVSAELYRQCAQSGRFVTTHIAESTDEDEMFRQGRGRMYDTVRNWGRDMSDCGKVGPVELLDGYGVLGANCLAVHANCLTPADIGRLARTGTSVVHCPKTHRYFRRTPAPLAELQQAGVNICLGTDSLASNDGLDLFAEMRELARAWPTWSPEQILATVTTNAANALQRSDRLGKIASGAMADLIAVPVTGRTDPVATVVLAEKPVTFIMINGKAV